MTKTRKNANKKRNNITNITNRTLSCKFTQIPTTDKDITAVIDVKALEHNLNFLNKKTGTDLMPVIKADAYGHGLIEIAKNIRKLNIKYIGVATLGEAILLRKSGDKGRILSWLYDIEGNEMSDSFDLDLDIAIFDETHIPILEKMVPNRKRIKVTMFVDTGINRAGIPYDKAYDACIQVSKCEKFELVGLMSHLVCSEIKNSPIVNEQLRKFRDLRKRLEEIGIKPPLVHIANTGACLNYDVSDFTLSRPGGGIYGLDNKINKNLKLIMTVKSYIIQLKDVNKGEGIGYNWKYITPKKMRVAVLPIGYADIIPRSASGKLFVYINGTKRKVLGTISMDQIIVEAKERDKINDDVIIFGNGENCQQTIYDVAKLGNIAPYEMSCHTGYRINRTYIN